MSVWHQGVIPGQERRWALGGWLVNHGLASPAWLPSPRAKMGLRYKRPKFYVATVVIANAGQTGYANIRTVPNFRLMAIMGQGTAASPADGCGSFAVQLFDDARRQNFQEQPIPNPVVVGNAQHPFVLKNPYRINGTAPIKIKITNRATGANTVTIVLYGAGD